MPRLRPSVCRAGRPTNMSQPETFHASAGVAKALISALSRFVWRTIPVSACEGSMLHEGEESSSRKLLRVEGRSFEGVGLLWMRLGVYSVWPARW